jgi:lipopolysaccharide transport system ATP-binding protein
MSTASISVSGLCKEYAIGTPHARHSTFYDLLTHSMRKASGRAHSNAPHNGAPESFWALRGVDLEVKQGEVMGLIGRNGAGKSTLLKILSRITAPTRGRVELRGRVASLLEVGTGFHPELSGRENIFLNGAILGMSRAEVAAKLEAIVEFAEISKFIDTPVKRYSSGMYVRLAFAVAAHLEPDILIVDEVLAVGDADFQQKCVGHMAAISKQGRTLLVVSHNMQLIQQLCPVAALLERGQLVAVGTVDQVQSKYLGGKSGSTSWTPAVRDSQQFQYDEVRIVPPEGYSADALPANRFFCIEFRFELSAGITGRIALRVRNQFGLVVFTSSDTDGEAYVNKRWQQGAHVERCTIPAGLLTPGQYWLTISRPLAEGNEILEDVCSFTVDRAGSLVERDYREGVVAPLLQWDVGAAP